MIIKEVILVTPQSENELVKCYELKLQWIPPLPTNSRLPTFVIDLEDKDKYKEILE